MNLDYRARPIKWSRYHTVAHSCGKDKKQKGRCKAGRRCKNFSHSQLSATFTAGDRLSDENTIVSAGQTCSCRSRCVLFVLQRNAASLSLCLVEVQLSVTRDSRFNLALASTLCSIWARVTWAQSCLNATYHPATSKAIIIINRGRLNMQFLLWSTIESWSQVFGSKLTQSPANGFNLPHRASTDTYVQCKEVLF